MSTAGEIEITGAPGSSGDITVSVNGTGYAVSLDGTETVTEVAEKIASRLSEVSGFGESQHDQENAGYAYIWGDTEVTSFSFADTDSTGTTANTQTLTFFTWRGDKQFTQETEFRTLVTQMENGPEQRRNKQPKRRIFQLPFTQFESDAQDITDFFEARQGRFDDFYWQHPDTGEGINVRFGNDNLSRNRDHGLAQSFQIILREIL